MRFSLFDSGFIRAALTFLALLVATALTALTANGQQLAKVVGSEFSVSRNEAALRLELADGRSVQLALRNNEAFVDGNSIGSVTRGSDFDRAWRDLLNRAMDLPTEQLPQMLLEWEPPASEISGRFTHSIHEVLGQATALDAPAVPVVPLAPGVAPLSDSVTRLVEKITDLERMVDHLESNAVERAQSRSYRRSPFRHITEGLAGVFSILIGYVVLFGIGFLVILFGGRKYIEGVADTARQAPGRSLLVGMAAAFLVFPAYLLGFLALIVSIVGIPAVLLWAPAFPLAVIGACVLGYISVAHAAGESFAERRYYVTDWFKRGNSYYFLISGIGLLLAFFLASQVVHMAGPWLNFISGILIFFGVITTIAAASIGFGAVLISRAGTRPTRSAAMAEEADLFTEEAGV